MACSFCTTTRYITVSPDGDTTYYRQYYNTPYYYNRPYWYDYYRPYYYVPIYVVPSKPSTPAVQPNRRVPSGGSSSGGRR